MNVLVGEAVLAILAAGFAAYFAVGFSTLAAAQRSVRRIRDRSAAFRVAGFVLVSGVVFATQSDAIMYYAGIDRHDPRVTEPLLFGFGLVVLGIALLDLVLWWPDRGAGATPR